jgi:hypothetical protein
VLVVIVLIVVPTPIKKVFWNQYDNQTSTTFSACAVQYLFNNKKLITVLPLGLFAQQNSQQQQATSHMQNALGICLLSFCQLPFSDFCWASLFAQQNSQQQ